MKMTINYSRQGDVHTIETGGAALPQLIIDNTNIPPEQRGGTAKQLLGAAALFCYCSALVGALDARNVKYSNVKGSATLHVGGNDLGQGRVQKIDINVDVALSEEDASTFERIEKIMKQGCLVTGSLHDGIEMAYNLNPEYQD